METGVALAPKDRCVLRVLWQQEPAAAHYLSAELYDAQQTAMNQALRAILSAPGSGSPTAPWARLRSSGAVCAAGCVTTVSNAGFRRQITCLSLTLVRVTRVPDFVRRRWARLILLVLFALASLGLGFALWLSDDDTGEQLIAVVGLFVSLAALVVSIIALLPPLSAPRDTAELADYLATTVHEQWEDEVTARGLRDPRVIPLAWSATQRPVAGPPETMVSTVEGGPRILRLSLDGRLTGDFDTAARQLAEGFAQVPSRRLVVLGEPGAGKTVLATMLTLGLLVAREPRGPVPVLLSVSTWDPMTEPLGEWVVRSLATAYYGGQPDLPRRLLQRRLLLPVLDGLDEMPEAARRGAVRAIDEACGDGQGVVVTCRSVEYQDVIEGGSPVLRRAPVVEVEPVPIPDILTYLREVSWSSDADWEPVYARLEAQPDSPLATALSTPLALSLVRTVYRTPERRPAELLSYESRHAIEDHLVDQLIPAAYAPGPGERDGSSHRQQAERAERYLTYLAMYLHRYRERDLAWWLMSGRLLSRWTGIALGIMVGLITMVIAAMTVSLVDPGAGTLKVSSYVSVGIAVLTMLTWYGPVDRTPGRLSLSLRNSRRRLGRGAFTGLRVMSVLVLPAMLTAAAVLSLDDGWSDADTIHYCTALALALSTAAAVAMAFSLHAWLDAPPEQSVGSGPLDLLRRDRASSLTGALMAGTVLGTVLAPLAYTGLYIAYATFFILSRHRATVPPGIWDEFTSDIPLHSSLVTVLALALLPGVAFAVLILLSRAWSRFAVLRLVLAVRRVTPWRLNRFLADARDRQLLRQSAGTYQFRHIRLQERLASRPRPSHTLPTWAERHRRQVLTVAAAGVFVLSVLTVQHALPRDVSQTVIMTGDIDAMALAPAPRHVLVTFNGDISKVKVRWWDTRTGKKFGEQSLRLPKHVTWSGQDIGYIVPALLAPGRADLRLWVTQTSAQRGSFTIPWNGGRPRVDVHFPGMREDSHGKSMQYFDSPALSTEGTYALSRYVTSAGVQMIVRDTQRGRFFGSFMTMPESRDYGHFAVGSDGTRMAMIIEDERIVSLYNTQTGDHRTCRIPREPIDLAMDSSGNRFAAVTTSRAVLIYDGCREVKNLYAAIGSSSHINHVTLSGDGNTLATAADNTVRIWNLKPQFR